MVQGIERREKRYVEVIADFARDGQITPLAIVWKDGQRFDIERVLDKRQAASRKCGGTGMRYYIEIGGKRTFLYHEQPRWFVEEKIRTEPGY